MSPSPDRRLALWHEQTDAAEPTLEPDLRIVDPHHHLWASKDPISTKVGAIPNVKWQTEYGAPDLLADIKRSGHNVVATVFVEASASYLSPTAHPVEFCPVGESGTVQRVADACGQSGVQVGAGIVVYIDLSLDPATVKAVLAAHRAACPNLRGVRFSHAFDGAGGPHNSFVSSLVHPDSLLNDSEALRGCLLSHPRVRSNIPLLVEHGLSLDVWGYSNHLPEVVALAQAFPELTMVVDHIGGPLRRGLPANELIDADTRWRTHITELAQCPNIVVKVGGGGMANFGMGFSKLGRSPSSEAVADACFALYSFVIRTFGPNRCMFESNFPVDKASFSYKVHWNAAKRIVARMHLAENEKAALFAKTAERTYRLSRTTVGLLRAAPSSIRELQDLAQGAALELRRRRQRCAVVEATAGGFISAALLSVPNASRYFVGGACVYSGRSAKALLPKDTLKASGLGNVKENYSGRDKYVQSKRDFCLVAREMLERFDVDYCLVESGTAGPVFHIPGVEEGFTAVACVGRSGVERLVVEFTGSSDRLYNMARFTELALSMLQRTVAEAGGSGTAAL